MAVPDEPDDLLRRAAAGDASACDALLALHRDRLRRTVAYYFDGRLTARLDPSDVVQEALIEAHRQLPDYLRDRPIPFFPWLRQIAFERLAKARRSHLGASKRSVEREQAALFHLPDDSMHELANRLMVSGSSPSQRAERGEMQAHTRRALAQRNERDREVLVLRYLEQLTFAEIAAVLGATENAVKLRHLRAIERLRSLLGEDSTDERP